MGGGRGVCCAPIAARAFRKAPLKGELSPEATERLKGCRIAKHFGNSMPRKTSPARPLAVPPPLSGEALAQCAVVAAPVGRDDHIPPLGRLRRAQTNNLSS